jgi:hypothetical protein
MNEHNYIPVARSSNLFDEIVFVANKNVENPQISDLNNSNVISVNSMLVTRVGIKYLLDKDMTPSFIKPAASWMAVVKSIFRSEEKYGFIYKDFYEGLNSLSKSGLQKIAETQDGTIHHNLLVSPKLKAVVMKLQQCLIEMNDQGEREKDILESLGIDQFIAVTEKDILNFETLATLGSELMENKEAAPA